MGDSVPSVSNVLSAIKATLISRQDGILESELDADYRELMGTGIPYKQLGYHSLSELIASEKSLTFKVMGGSKYVVAAESKSSHVASLIAGQKKQPAKKKKSASLHKLFHLNTPRPNSKLRGGGSSQRSRSGRRGWRNTKNVSPLMENLPTSHGSISSATMPDYYRPKPKSTRPPLLPNPSRSPSLPNQPSHSHMNGIPAGLESEDSFEDLEIEDSHAKISPLFHPTNNNVKLLPEASKPPTSPTLLLQPSWRTSTSTSTSTSLPKLLPSAPIPKPVNLNETDVNSNGYDRTRKISGKSKRAASMVELSSNEDSNVVDAVMCQPSCVSFSQITPMLGEIIRRQQALECSLRIREMSHELESQDHFATAKVWANQLKALDLNQRILAENFINRILCQARLGNLNDDSLGIIKTQIESSVANISL